jgi:hypothetical protein
MIGLFLVIYVLGAILTFVINRSMIIGQVTYPWALVRNAIFWPVCLPMILWILITGL